MGLQSCGSPNFGYFKINLKFLRQNGIWVLAPWLGIENIIRGRWWLPLSLGHGESCEFVFARGSFVHQKCSNYTLTNLLFSLCKSMWIIDLLVTRLSPHPRTPTCPFAPKVLRAKERAPTPYPSIVFTLGLIVKSIKEFGGVSTTLFFPLHLFCYFNSSPCAFHFAKRNPLSFSWWGFFLQNSSFANLPYKKKTHQASFDIKTSPMVFFTTIPPLLLPFFFFFWGSSQFVVFFAKKNPIELPLASKEVRWDFFLQFFSFSSSFRPFSSFSPSSLCAIFTTKKTC